MTKNSGKHREKFLQTLLGRNTELESLAQNQADSVQLLQLENERIKSLLQAQNQIVEQKSSDTQRLEQIISTQTQEISNLKVLLNDQVLMQQKLTSALNDKNLELKNSQKQVLYLSKLVQTSKGPSLNEVNDQMGVDFKSFVDLCILLKVFATKEEPAYNSINSLDDLAATQIINCLVGLQKNNENVLKELERVLKFLGEGVQDKLLADSLVLTFKLLFTSHVSIGYLYKSVGATVEATKAPNIDPSTGGSSSINNTTYTPITSSGVETIPQDFPSQIVSIQQPNEFTQIQNINNRHRNSLPSGGLNNGLVDMSVPSLQSNSASFASIPEMTSQFKLNSATMARNISEPLPMDSIPVGNQEPILYPRELLTEDLTNNNSMKSTYDMVSFLKPDLVTGDIEQLQGDFGQKFIINDNDINTEILAPTIAPVIAEQTEYDLNLQIPTIAPTAGLDNYPNPDQILNQSY